ncbi:hypothetical protein Xen7305DRAFT_00007770 [Xenococcus sp. PCC 7305]|uniref:hypothetical protein n=1 Tax=Xenococcus sp. PCC 7305 TaxID=102125 RepID=UPI0002ABF75B|nr:hypothetical protein [Xenococcus sp. PCC 7305]ELS01076.1 hypothetical protein Xen7305DRAFT_00007770 [Xenococcus sp. PCC 7305]
MSMSISISLLTQDNNFVKAFASLIRRLTAKSDYIKIKRLQKYQITEGEELDLETLISILESPNSESLIYSEDAFRLSISYTLASGEGVPLTIEFNGKGYGDGHKARNDSSLRVTAQDSSLWRS